MASRNLRRRTVDDDDDNDPTIFDEHGILRDGATYRVPMRFADAMQRDVFAAANGRGLLHRPGFVARDAASTQQLHDAYASYEADLTSAWQRDAEPDIGVGVHAMLGARAGDVCQVRNAQFPDDFGAPGHLRMIGGNLVCVPDKPRAASPPPLAETSGDARRVGDAKAKAMAEYEADLTSAWKNAT